ncbi:MAG: hypothetical protein QMC70_10665 [Bacteroidia bacterium]|jgi:hypothetical protein|tara:strand:- start:13799 stop:14380 length:582 start_codon:yes stop_codon:yes gene_type:complete
MKKVLQALSVLTHPIFLPIFSLVIYAPIVAKYGENAIVLSLIWIGFVYLLLPLLYFKFIRKMNLAMPNLDERRSIFRAYSLINAGFIFVSIFIMTEYVSFFMAAMLLHIIMLLLAFVEMKASWHTAVWTFLTLVGLMVLYNYSFVGFESIVFLPLSILVAVILIRKAAKAHTWFELGMGGAAGAFASLPVLFF